MAVFIVLWPYLLTTKLKSVIRHNLGHSIPAILPTYLHTLFFVWFNVITFIVNKVFLKRLLQV